MTIAPLMLTLALAAQVAGPLTPDDAVRLALARSGSVKAAYLDADIARADKELALKPVMLRLGHDRIDGPLGTPYTDNNGVPFAPLDDSYVALGWDLPTPEDAVDLFVADDAYQANRFDAQTIERDFAAGVRLLHAQVVSLRAEAELARNALEIATQLEAKTNEQLAAEVSTSLDARLAGLERLDAAADAETMTGDALRAEYELAGLVGLAAPLNLAAPAQPLCAPQGSSVDELLARATLRSEKLAKHKARRERAAFQSSLAWTRLLPFIDGFQVGWHDEPLAKRDTVRARLDISLPIFEPFAGSSRVADLELLRADAMYAEEQQQLGAKIRGAVTRLERAVALVHVHEASESGILDESVRDVARALEAGQADVLRVAEVQSRAVRGRRSLIRARFRCEQAAIELARITGDVVAEQPPQ